MLIFRQEYMYREMEKLSSVLPNMRLMSNRYSTIWGGASLLTMLVSAMRYIVSCQLVGTKLQLKLKCVRENFFTNVKECCSCYILHICIYKDVAFSLFWKIVSNFYPLV